MIELQTAGEVLRALGWTHVTVNEQGLHAASDSDGRPVIRWRKVWGWSTNAEDAVRSAVMDIAAGSYLDVVWSSDDEDCAWAAHLFDKRKKSILEPSRPALRVCPAMGESPTEAWILAAAALLSAGLLPKAVSR